VSYNRRAKDRQRALRSRYGAPSTTEAPRTYHRLDERRGGPMASKKDYKRTPKHKGGWGDE